VQLNPENSYNTTDSLFSLSYSVYYPKKRITGISRDEYIENNDLKMGGWR
jgi:hypothetical protein